MDSHARSPFGSDLKAYTLEATRTWHVQNEFSDCRCDTVCIWYNDSSHSLDQTSCMRNITRIFC